MHVEDKTKAFKQVVRKDQLDRLQEVRLAPEQWTQQQNLNARRRAPNPMRRNLEMKSKRNLIWIYGKNLKIKVDNYSFQLFAAFDCVVQSPDLQLQIIYFKTGVADPDLRQAEWLG